MKGISDLLGRIFIGIIFIYEGLDTLLFFDQTKETMAEYGITFYPNILVGITLTLLFLGAVLVIIGYLTRFGALLLMLYWIPYTLMVYDFWNAAPDMQRLQALDFMRNLGVLGGLLLILTNGSGEYSVKRLIHVMRLPK